MLFKDHISLQKEELAARIEQSRADEKIEVHRLTVDSDMHRANLSHAGKVLDAQALDRRETRDFWKSNLQCVFWLILAVMIILAGVMGIALFQGKASEVIGLIKDLGGYVVAVIAGAGLDRAWIHRRKTGISSPTPDR